MQTFTIAHITDTHLSEAKPQFAPNFLATVGLINDLAPDLVVNTGDITVDGADDDSDHRYAYDLHENFSMPWLAIPGNHDLGDNPSSEAGHSLMNPARRQRYREYWGDDFWGMDAGEFRLLGLNAQLFGTGGEDEAEQWDVLSDEAAMLRDRPVILFIHKPLFKDSPAESATSQRYVAPTSRNRLLDLLRPARLRLIASGHVHQHRQFSHDAVLHSWGPSTAFILPDEFQPVIGAKQVGFVLYRLEGDRVTAEVHTPEALDNNDLIDFPQPYGSLRDRLAAKRQAKA